MIDVSATAVAVIVIKCHDARNVYRIPNPGEAFKTSVDDRVSVRLAVASLVIFVNRAGLL